jgi:hypothetical protein
MDINELATKEDLAAFQSGIIDAIKELLKTNYTKEPDAENKLMTKHEMTLFLDISENKFKELVDRGLPFLRVGARARYIKNDVLNWLKENG